MENHKVKNKSITLHQLMNQMNLEPLTTINEEIEIFTPNIYRVGYELTGFFGDDLEELQNYIHVLGRKETVYLSRLNADRKKDVLEQYFAYPFSIIILSQDASVDEEFLRLAQSKSKQVLRLKLKTTEAVRELKFYLQLKLSKEIIVEGYVFMEIYGVGVLITGDEDAKVGAAVELLERGHKIVGDDSITVIKSSLNELRGMSTLNRNTKDSHFFIMNKDNVKIDVMTHFGIKGTRSSKRIDMIVNLEKWNEKKFYDRLGIDEVYEEILDVKVPTLTLPVRKGRNLAVIIEASTMNQRLKKMGENSAEYFWKETQKIIMENKARKGQDSFDMRKKLPLREFIKNFSVKVLSGEEYIESKNILTTGVHRPSLALSGYYDMYDDEGYTGIQVFSEIEFKFLENLPEQQRISNLEKYLSYGFPVLILTKGATAPDYFLELIKGKNIVLCRSQYGKAAQIMALYNSFLENYFSPEISMHGVFLELYGYGVLLVGKSGIGKSETALELIHRGHRLVADDLVKFVKTSNGEVVGKAARLPYFMEVRGLGIIDIKALYGLGAVRINKKLDAIIELHEQKNEEYLTSVNYQSCSTEVLGIPFNKASLFISSGRNAAAMVEIAVMNIMARMIGHDPEKAYKAGIQRLTEEEIKILNS